MDLKGQSVVHKVNGVGVIVAQGKDTITVEFARKTCKFQYPDENTFEKFLKLVDENINLAVMKEQKEEKERKEQARIQEMEEKRKAAEVLAMQAQEKKQKSKEGSGAKKAEVIVPERLDGKPMIFYVFQSETFAMECEAGYIWAPALSYSGGKVFHWDNMLLIRKGDIVLHGSKGCVAAVSCAISDCYDCYRPKERDFEGSWNNDGRRVDLAYTVFDKPIKTSDFRKEIIEYCKAKYSPFDRDGNGNMGYLYVLNRELAKVFLRAAARENPGLTNKEYIAKLIEED